MRYHDTDVRLARFYPVAFAAMLVGTVSALVFSMQHPTSLEVLERCYQGRLRQTEMLYVLRHGGDVLLASDIIPKGWQERDTVRPGVSAVSGVWLLRQGLGPR